MDKYVVHLGLIVSDIERSAGFYAKLGFERQQEVPDEHDEAWAKQMNGFPDTHIKLLNMTLGGVTIELIQFLVPAGSSRTSLRPNDAGSAHICIGVDDVWSEYQCLRGQGVEFRSEPVSIEEGVGAGIKAVYMFDPDGNTAELLQWGSGGH